MKNVVIGILIGLGVMTSTQAQLQFQLVFAASVRSEALRLAERGSCRTARDVDTEYFCLAIKLKDRSYCSKIQHEVVESFCRDMVHACFLENHGVGS